MIESKKDGSKMLLVEGILIYQSFTYFNIYKEKREKGGSSQLYLEIRLRPNSNPKKLTYKRIDAQVLIALLKPYLLPMQVSRQTPHAYD